VPLTRADGRSFSERLTPPERLALVQTGYDASRSSGAASLFPADFGFSPETGAALTRFDLGRSAPWVPPFGAPVKRPGAPQLSDIRGIRQTPRELTLTRAPKVGAGPDRSATDDPDRVIPPPPPGQYEFAVGRFGADTDCLLAIEPEKGSLFFWLTASNRWAPVNHVDGGVLSQTSVDASHWRSELVQEGGDIGGSVLFLPTTSGLAVVRPDAITLEFSADYIGGGASLGAPVLWGGVIWAPVKGVGRTIALVAASTKGELLNVQATSCAEPAEALGAPVCDARRIVWPSQAGQFVVSKNPDGTAHASWLNWPDDARPVFAFGVPYLSAAGQFWQLCWNAREESYVYVQLGRPGPEIMPTNAPALCTGRRSYKMASAMQGDPWEDPVDMSHGSSSDVVIPLLESTQNGAVLGLVVAAEDGVTALLESRERHPAVMLLRTDTSPNQRFLTLLVSKPWRVRAFIFDGYLWAYHPAMQSILGTELGRR
jgi:hypothetical protein